jgi:hypothetical protein
MSARHLNERGFDSALVTAEGDLFRAVCAKLSLKLSRALRRGSGDKERLLRKRFRDR